MRTLLHIALFILLIAVPSSAQQPLIAFPSSARQPNPDVPPTPPHVTSEIKGGVGEESPVTHYSKTAPPAWAQTPIRSERAGLRPFGSNLFQGEFGNTFPDELNSDYVIMPGDRIVVRVWGAENQDEILIVDAQGNIFLPQIGPIRVAGLKYSKLNSAVMAKVSTVFTRNVDVYTNLLNSQPVAVYVTGFVNRPGRYAGGPTESALYYLDRAGGINADFGSYRDIKIMRGDKPIASIDLYQFILKGILPYTRLRDGDVILVGRKGPSVAVSGLVRQPAWYELNGPSLNGRHLSDLVSPMNNVTHVSISGTRNKEPFNAYLIHEAFQEFSFIDNDLLVFHADKPALTIMVGVKGATIGPSRYIVNQGTSLRALLHHVPVDDVLANLQGIYLQRRSVADQQKRAISDALRRLEQSVLTATSASVDEANIRVKEAELIQNFIKRAALLEPDGVLVVFRRDQLNDVVLENGDQIVIPQKSDVVQISGEVLIPKSIVYAGKLGLQEYIDNAGGYTNRADKKSILVVKPNGEVAMLANLDIGPGDQLLVMPKYDTKNLQLFKDLTQILYQIAIATSVALDL